VDKVHTSFCKKLVGIPNCTANGFADMEFGRESKRGKCIGQILKHWYQITCLEMEEPKKQCYEWQKSNVRVKSWAMDSKKELHNIGLAFVWSKQHECNMREMIKIVKRQK
jgi:hypothetical protein